MILFKIAFVISKNQKYLLWDTSFFCPENTKVTNKNPML